MSSSSVAGVLAALGAIHDGATPPDQRRAALRFCDEFRALGFGAVPGALDLVAPDMNDQARHFGLQTLIGVVDRHWNTLAAPDKQAMMRTGLDLVRSGTSGGPNGPNFVYDMIALLVVDMAAREWPQHWPTLHADLLQASRTSVPAQHLTVLVFAALADLIVTPTVKGRRFLPERRRAEIRTGLEAVLADVNAFLIGALQSGDRALVLAALRCVASYADWASPAALVSGRIMSALSALFATAAYFEAAAEPLQRLCARKPPSPAGDDFAAEIESVWKATATITADLVRAAPFPDQLRLVKIAADLVAVLARYHRGQLVRSEPIRNAFLSVLGDLLRIDDPEIGIVVLSIWTPILKASSSSPTGAQNVAIIPGDQRQAVLRELFLIALARFMATRPNPSPGPGIDDADAEDEAAERSRQYQKYRSAILDLVKTITTEAPLMALQLTSPNIVRLLSTPPSDHLNAAGHGTAQTSSILQLQACCVLLHAVLDTAPFRDGAGSDAALLSGQQALLSAVLQAAAQDPQVVARQAHLLSLFPDVLARAPAALQAVVDKLLWMNGFVPGGVRDQDAVVHQRRALTSLVVIARKPPCAALLLKWFADLSPVVLSLCRSRPAHAPALLEVLVTICNGLPSASDRVQYALQLVGAELREFAAFDMGRFLQVFGLMSGPPVQVDVDGAVALRDDRHRVLLVFNTIQYVFRGVAATDAESQQVLYGALSGLCANACAILSTIHAFYSPSRIADAAPAARAVFEPWTTEGDRIAAQADVGRKDVLDQIRTQTYAVRDHCYMLLQSALSCPFVFAGDQHVLNQVVQTCLSDACLGTGPDALHPSRIVPILNKVWSPFLDKCPVQHPLFLFVFARLVQVLSGRLSAQWASVVGGAGADAVGIEREVFEENALRELTRAFMSTIQSALSPHNWVAFSDVPAADNARDSACRAVCDDPGLAAATVHVLHVGLQVPDSVTQARAAALIARLLPTLATPAHARDLFVPILDTCLRLLSAMTKSVVASSASGQDLMGLVFEILQRFATVDRAPFDLLLRQPRVVQEEAESLLETLASSAQATKAMRAATRAFVFAYVTERDESSPVRDLPSRLVLPEKQLPVAEPTSPLDLPDLFP